jgi:TonB family protein
MRSLVRLAVLAPAALVAVFAACGGSTVKAPDPQPAASSAPTPSAEPTSPGSTTTRVEEDAGLGQKLEPKSDGRSAEDIAAKVRAKKPETRACYDKVASKNPKIEGDVDVKFVIDPQGNLTDVAVDPAHTNVGDEAVGKCLVDVMKTLKFPPSAKGLETRAHYPFNFKRNLDQFRAARDAGIIQQ